MELSRKTLLVINTDSPEHRVGLVENGDLTELFLERRHGSSNVGNIYKGRVVRVLPGMQAAFVDIGMDRAAFLYVTDVVGGRLPATLKLFFLEEEGSPEEGGESEEDLKLDLEHEETMTSALPRIEDLLSPGQDILVQVAKDPIGSKGSRVTGYITVPGRHLVYMPYVHHVGISRKIKDEAERSRLRELMEDLHRDGEGGFIVRTAAEGQSRENLAADVEYLQRLWRKTLERHQQAPAPALTYRELDLVLRCVRDLFTAEMDACWVDSEEHAARIQQFMQSFMPQAQDRVQVYTGPMPVFDHFDIETQIRQALAQKVWLRSGGYLVFQRTEALTTIDVNTGGYVGQRTLEDTITQTNLEAAKEIPRQLRLRNIGGLVVIDFIDMENESNQQKVMQVFTEALSFDRARHMVLPISQFGLMQLTRQRTRESLLTLMTSSCPYCEGKGFNRSLSSLCSEIIREIIRKSSQVQSTHLKISCHPDVADALAHEFGSWLENLEERFHKAYNVHAVEHMHLEDFDVHPVMEGEHTTKIQMPSGPGH